MTNLDLSGPVGYLIKKIIETSLKVDHSQGSRQFRPFDQRKSMRIMKSHKAGDIMELLSLYVIPAVHVTYRIVHVCPEPLLELNECEFGILRKFKQIFV